MHFHVETLLSEPVIAAVKTESALTAALASPLQHHFSACQYAGQCGRNGAAHPAGRQAGRGTH